MMAILAVAEKYSFKRAYLGGNCMTGLCSYDINAVLQEQLKYLSAPSADIYEIEINITAPVREKSVASKPQCRGYRFYVADDIKTDTQILADVQKKYDNVLNTWTPVGKPAVLTAVFGKRVHVVFPSDKDAQPAKTPIQVVEWHILNPNKDIVVDRNLHQIYPVKTGAYPTMIQKLLEKQR